MSGDRPVRPPHRVAFASSSIAVGLGLCLAGLLPSAAWARTETVAWSYAMPCQVESFELRWGTSPEADALTNVQDVGKPHQSGSQFSYQVDVPDDQEIYACVAAHQGGQVSPCSNVRLFSPSAPSAPIATPPAPAHDEQLYCQDFTSGRDEASWRDTGPSGSGPLFSVAGGNPALVTSSPQNDVWSHFRGVAITGSPAVLWTGYELSGDMRVTDVTAGIGVTLYSAYPDSAAYYRLGRAPGGDFHLERDHMDRSFLCDNPSTDVVPQPNVSYTFRVRARPDANGRTVVEAKVWRSDEREPQGFPASCVDARVSSPVAGAIGVWSASGGTKVWDNLAVATVPEVPPSTDPLGPPGKPELQR